MITYHEIGAYGLPALLAAALLLRVLPRGSAAHRTVTRAALLALLLIAAAVGLSY
ncbi:hypothetical protein [Streptomyces sp. NPDC006638]|uniref:hypothetical protein n=1 Tax=Streptomyces sp. NPDC006638 TaxID=3157183 RepID=UPI00339E8857